jgi:hypothetical protein
LEYPIICLFHSIICLLDWNIQSFVYFTKYIPEIKNIEQTIQRLAKLGNISDLTQLGVYQSTSNKKAERDSWCIML